MLSIALFGSSGALGTELRSSFEARGFDVVAPSRNSVDLLRPDRVHEFLRAGNFEVVINAAGVVRGSTGRARHAKSILTDNSRITFSLLDALQETGVDKAIFFNTARLLDEQDFSLSSQLTQDPYVLAKAVQCQAIRNGRCESGTRISEIYLENLYSSSDKFDLMDGHLVSSAIIRVKNALDESFSSISVPGLPTSRRMFSYTPDIAEWLAKALEARDELPQTLRLSIGKEATVMEVYETVAKLMGFHGSIYFEGADREQRVEFSDSIEVVRSEGTSLESGLAEMVSKGWVK